MFGKILKRAGLGFLLGMTAGNLISWATGLSFGALVSAALIERMGSEAGALAVQTLLSGLYGAACLGGTLLYDIESWPLALSTAAHYLIIALLYAPLALVLGWSSTLSEILLVELIQFVVFFLIWIVMYAIYRKQVRELNAIREQMEKKKSK